VFLRENICRKKNEEKKKMFGHDFDFYYAKTESLMDEITQISAQRTQSITKEAK